MQTCFFQGTNNRNKWNIASSPWKAVEPELRKFQNRSGSWFSVPLNIANVFGNDQLWQEYLESRVPGTLPHSCWIILFFFLVPVNRLLLFDPSLFAVILVLNKFYFINGTLLWFASVCLTHASLDASLDIGSSLFLYVDVTHSWWSPDWNGVYLESCNLMIQGIRGVVSLILYELLERCCSSGSCWKSGNVEASTCSNRFKRSFSFRCSPLFQVLNGTDCSR